MFLWLNTSLELQIEFGSQFITPVTTYVYLMPWLWWSQAINNSNLSRRFLPQGFLLLLFILLCAQSPISSHIWLLFQFFWSLFKCLLSSKACVTTNWSYQPILFSIEHFILSTFLTRLELHEKVYSFCLSASCTQNSPGSALARNIPE